MKKLKYILFPILLFSLVSLAYSGIGDGIIGDGSVAYNDNAFSVEQTFNAGINLKNGSTSAGYADFFEDSDNGSNYVRFIGPSSTGDITITLPDATGTVVVTGNNEYRDFKKLDLTTDTSITEAQILTYKFITNQGDTGEADLTLPAVSYAIQVVFIIEEVQNIEINPPTGETFDLDGTTLDANDCVDSDSTVGSKIVATRMQNASGTWHWSLDTARGVWTDTGASD